MSNIAGSFDLADFDINQAPRDFVPEIVDPEGNSSDKDNDAND